MPGDPQIPKGDARAWDPLVPPLSALSQRNPTAAKAQERIPRWHRVPAAFDSSAGTGRREREADPSHFSRVGLPCSVLRLLVICLLNIPHQLGDFKARGTAALL